MKDYHQKSNRQVNFNLLRHVIQLTVIHQQKAKNEKGFVLPLALMLLLVLTVTVASTFIRSGQQGEEVLSERENRKIYNAAAPAIERAKAKIEYYFSEDAPAGLPSGAAMQNTMLDDTDYTLLGENRLDVNGDGNLDNAWVYQTDIDGDGIEETVAYSIIMTSELDADNDGVPELTIADDDLEAKAENLITRSGPLSIKANSVAAACPLPELKTEGGWYAVNDASLRKSFQINAVVANKNDLNRSVIALEFQQDRQVDRGNKWAAWFRYDLELFPGPDFNWNGAVYTAGNLMLGQQSNKIKLHLISSPKSCLYTEDSSEITIAQYKADNSNDIEFQGQVMTYSSINNSFSGNAITYLYPGAGKKPTSANIKTLDNTTDSVVNSPGKPFDYSLNPIVLFTEDLSRSRSSTDTSNVSFRDNAWSNSDINTRIFNRLERKPYVDDTHRADDRYGPKPRYSPPGSKKVISVTASNNGQPIIAEDQEIMTKSDVPDGAEDEVGLDGYWERRARLQGLRLIVGERLELGNAFGWKNNDDPLYPINDNTLDNEERQRKTMRDNLAAVQSMAIYHQDNSDQDFPVACMALTAHPGNQNTIQNSTTFEEVTINGEKRLDVDFLNGKGTNGWEFSPPGNVTSTTDFIPLIDDTDDPLRIALRNLAYFAGDPDGAFPPKQEDGGSLVHPYPQLTMWGNYSNLRRVINSLDSGTTYNDLSIADKTTIHNGSCTLGMLTYNVKNQDEKEKESETTAQTALNLAIPGMQAFASHLWQLVDGNGIDNNNGNEVNRKIDSKVYPPSGYDRNKASCTSDTDLTCAKTFYAQFGAQEFEEAIQNKNGLNSAQKATYIANAQALVTAMQSLNNISQTRTIEDDRTLGFVDGKASGLQKSIPGDIDWDPITGKVSLEEGSNNVTFRTACDPDLFDAAVPGNADKEKFKIALAMAFCSPKDYPTNNTPIKPKYPSLYYLFPKIDHDHSGGGNTETFDDQPVGEEYIADTYIQGINSYVYQVLDNTADNGLTTIALQPRAIVDASNTSNTLQSTLDAWELPNTTSNTNIRNQITYQGKTYYVPFLDKGIFNGRELMASRVLDIDLNMLRNNYLVSDQWFPSTGLIYAFREDAVREDAIARPANKTWSQCNTETLLTTGDAGCRMNVTLPQDPPRNSDTGVSPKPVDFYPDPERRPHGFRLRNGQDLRRTGSDRGLSFISDQPVYIQGNFNLHRNSSKSLIEEFTTLLTDNWSNFYNRNTLDTDFAKPDKDNWRPSEVVSDAVSILSDNFCDGNIESGIRNNNGIANCQNGSGRSSYRNNTIKGQNDNSWKRELEGNNDSPIFVDRNGFAYRGSTKYLFNSTNYNSMQAGRSLGSGVDGQRVNSIIVGGLVPSRLGQSYGGLHNFPRFLENWGGDDLHISGSIIQLNFSTYATAPFDSEKLAWEPGGSGQTGEQLPFYSPPNRRWGYDVALQYNPPGPVAERFVSQGTPRSEFYRELPIDDPYVKQLRCAANPKASGETIDLNATDCN